MISSCHGILNTVNKLSNPIFFSGEKNVAMLWAFYEQTRKSQNNGIRKALHRVLKEVFFSNKLNLKFFQTEVLE